MLQRIARHGAESAADVHFRVVHSGEAVLKTIAVSVDVADARVVNIHIAEIAPPAVIPRSERLSPSQRAPSKTPAESKPQAKAPAATAKPGDHGRRVPSSVPAAVIRTGR